MICRGVPHPGSVVQYLSGVAQDTVLYDFRALGNEREKGRYIINLIHRCW